MHREHDDTLLPCAFINLGGTIGERYDREGGLHRVPGGALLDAAGLPAHWPVHDLAQIDSVELTFGVLFAASDIIAADARSRGFILCCGTDLLEEIAFAASLLLPLDRAIVITAASVPFSEPGTDGPANLRRAATLLAQGGAGRLYVLMGDMIFDAAGLVKLEPQSIAPFGATAGAAGRFRADAAILSGGTRPEDGFRDLTSADCTARVAIVTECLDGCEDAFPDPARLDGLVVAGAGPGGLRERTRTMLRERYLPRMPVVLSTRCPFGFTVNPHVAKHAQRQARQDGFLLDEYAGLNALQARVRLILEIGRQRKMSA
ncbi:MAG: Asparaginase/glutaminase [Rhodospirillales bacterium]|nr:Asparaginase/glutaminase [Rhodospirillales bacterium]